MRVLRDLLSENEGCIRECVCDKHAEVIVFKEFE